VTISAPDDSSDLATALPIAPIPITAIRTASLHFYISPVELAWLCFGASDLSRCRQSEITIDGARGIETVATGNPSDLVCEKILSIALMDIANSDGRFQVNRPISDAWGRTALQWT
jgi:hypothetical protein